MVYEDNLLYIIIKLSFQILLLAIRNKNPVTIATTIGVLRMPSLSETVS